MDTPPPTEQAAEAAGAATQEFLFGAPGWLWLLLLLPLLLLLRRRSGTATGILHPTLSFAAAHLRRPATLAGRLGPIFLSLGTAALIIALARPQWRNTYEEQKVSGIDIMLACDLSGSMAAADMVFKVRDNRNRVRQTAVDRLTAAKHVLKEFIGGRPNDRIGLVAFAGRAKLCTPLTLDHGIVSYVIDQFYLAHPGGFGQPARPGYIEQDGTAIGSAIASAATRLNERKETKSKVIILVTDGVNNSGSITPVAAAELAKEMDIKIFTIAIGRDERLSRYTANVDTFDEKTLKEIAQITGGRYYRASSGAGLLRAFSSIDQLEKTEVKRRMLESYDEMFPWPMGAACILLGLGCLLQFTRPRPAP
ncbi:MAG: VWA domain-containing protein [Akkermansia sp.]|nr:VWA domain-containing protein [Akkermansia sp.]